MEKNNEQKYREALLSAKAKFSTIKMDKKNTHYGKYASLNAVMSAVEGPLTACGFNITHIIVPQDDGVMFLKTMIEHKDYGDPNPSYYPLNTATDHKFGSSITYGRRYSISAKLGILSEEDDDGNTSSGLSDKKAAPPKPTKPDMLAKLVAHCNDNHIAVGSNAARKILNDNGCKSGADLQQLGIEGAFKLIEKATGGSNE